MTFPPPSTRTRKAPRYQIRANIAELSATNTTVRQLRKALPPTATTRRLATIFRQRTSRPISLNDMWRTQNPATTAAAPLHSQTPPAPLARLREAGALLNLLRSPATRVAQIRQRQTAIAALRDEPALDDILHYKAIAYGVCDGIHGLSASIQVDDHGNRMTVLAAYQHPDYRHLVEHHVAQLERCVATGTTALAQLAQHVQQARSPVLAPLAQELQHACTIAASISFARILSSEDPLATALHHADRIFAILTPFGSFAEFAALVRREQYAAATFNTTQPVHFTQGWHFAHAKNKQVANDAPADAPTVIYTGSNMSGKSFALETQLYIQVLAQTFGFVPATSGNFRIYNSFHYLDRADTNHAAGLSAYGSEITHWNAFLAARGTRPFLCCDEGFSTTSPDGQFQMLVAVEQFLRAAHAKVFYATHNETFITHARAGDGRAIVHFSTSIDAAGKVTYHHTLRAGAGDSQALAVARDLGLPADICDTAQAYLDAKTTAIAPHSSTPPAPVIPYTEDERATLKTESLYPLTVMGDVDDNQRLLHLFSEDRSFAARTWCALHLGEHQRTNSPVRKVNDILWDTGTAREKCLHSFVFRGAPLNVRDVIERQHTFTELANHPLLCELPALEDRLVELIHITPYVYGMGRALLAFNRALYPEGDNDFAHSNDLLVTYLEMNAILLGDDFPCAAALAKFTAERAIEQRLLTQSPHTPLGTFISQVLSAAAEPVIAPTVLQHLAALRKRYPDVPLTDTSGAPHTVRAISTYRAALEQHESTRRDWRNGDHIAKLGKALDPDLRPLHALAHIDWDTLDRDIATTAADVGLAPPAPLTQLTLHQLEALYNSIPADDTPAFAIARTKISNVLYFVRNLLDHTPHPDIDPRCHTELRESIFQQRCLLTSAARSLPEVSLFAANVAAVRPHIEALAAARRNTIIANRFDYRSAEYRPERWAHPLAIEYLTASSDAIGDLLTALRSVDSVPLTQMANSLAEQLDGLTSGPALLQRCRKIYAQSCLPNTPHNFDTLLWKHGPRAADSGELFSDYDDPERYHTLAKNVTAVGVFVDIARAIRDEQHAAVHFAHGAAIALHGAWSLFAPRNEQIASDVHWDADETVKLITGANMSGKTFWLKKATAGLLWALQTGFAPAEHATLPPLDGVVYLDRVQSKHDQNLSAFGNEVRFWNQYLVLLASGKQVAVVSQLDEIFSTTSPRYQAALTYGIVTHALQHGQRLALAAHNHSVIEFLLANHTGIAPYHFAWQNRPGEHGDEFEPTYALTPGHRTSNAIAVARTLGMDPAVLAHAPKSTS